MSGRAKNPSWVLLGAVVSSVVLLTLPATSGADRSPAVARLRAENADLAAKTRSAELNLYALDAHLDSARSQLGLLQLELTRLEAQRHSIERQLRVATIDSRISQQRVAARLRYLYDYGDGASSLDIVLGATSVDQALTSIDDVDDVSAADANVLAELRAAEGRLGGLSRALALRGEQLSAATQELGATVSDLGQAQAQRSAFISQLTEQQSYNDHTITVLTARAQAAYAKSLALEQQRQQAAELSASAPAPTLSVAPAAAPQALDAGASAASPGGQALTVVATGYSLEGTTATGIPVGYGVAAVDPSVIPLGTHFNVPGYGEAVAADTGGAIIGGRIDLWFPTSAQAFAWGVRTVTIEIEG